MSLNFSVTHVSEQPAYPAAPPHPYRMPALLTLNPLRGRRASQGFGGNLPSLASAFAWTPRAPRARRFVPVVVGPRAVQTNADIGVLRVHPKGQPAQPPLLRWHSLTWAHHAALAPPCTDDCAGWRERAGKRREVPGPARGAAWTRRVGHQAMDGLLTDPRKPREAQGTRRVADRGGFLWLLSLSAQRK